MMGNPKYANYFVGMQFVIFTIIFIIFITQPLIAEGVPRIAGVVLMVIGLSVIFLAIRTHQTTNNDLPNVSPEPKTTVPLVEKGLYSRIRHPIYTGVITATFGAALAHGNLFGVLGAVVLLAFFTVKSQYEESLLRQRYPHYDDYMKRTGRFLPPLR